jgi:hypothetical protein
MCGRLMALQIERLTSREPAEVLAARAGGLPVVRLPERRMRVRGLASVTLCSRLGAAGRGVASSAPRPNSSEVTLLASVQWR